MSRLKQLSVVGFVANAQKQGVMRGEYIEASRTTMFQALELAELAEFLESKVKMIKYHFYRSDVCRVRVG